MQAKSAKKLATFMALLASDLSLSELSLYCATGCPAPGGINSLPQGNTYVHWT
jgi:hypothetical protein